MIDTRLKIAVFIDFDNIEIGVKTTLGLQLDVAAILEGVKERGEIVTKVAYGDWKRAGEYGRLLSQHAIRMVQRNVTPGGDKNGADINLALDALEMAFTHDHINAFVIVGGDSDFITLVEKLKQYDKKVFVVGGRQFTSFVMQKNCHEFIAYENLVSRRPATAGTTGRRSDIAPTSQADVAKVIPLVKRALKVLSDREVSPQLGLLKSTLLQLDSAFSERDYGASTFRDFIEKIAKTGAITLRNSGRSMLVDLLGTGEVVDVPPATTVAGPQDVPLDATPTLPASTPPPSFTQTTQQVHASQPPDVRSDAAVVADPELIQRSLERTREIFLRPGHPPRWPMYVRQLKQYMRGADEGFDERKWGFGNIVDLVRAGQREGLFRLERDRKGIMRVFAGTVLQRPMVPADATTVPLEIDSASEMGAGSEFEATPTETFAGISDERHEDELQQQSDSQDFALEPPTATTPVEEEMPGQAKEAAPRRGRARARKPAAGKPAARKSTGAKPAARRRKGPLSAG